MVMRRLAPLVTLLALTLAALADEPAPGAIRPRPLTTVKDAPTIQMLVPGFTVTELPVTLTNINNVAYARMADSSRAATTAGFICCATRTASTRSSPFTTRRATTTRSA